MSLADGVENLQLLGGAGGTAVGNALDNRLVGGSGNDRLDGGGGTDTLEGGIGTDTYVLRAGGGIDTVIDIPVDADLAVVAVDASPRARRPPHRPRGGRRTFGARGLGARRRRRAALRRLRRRAL
ncbi:MAG: hypothetical protein IPG28_18655 [Betaproteobacteria bacterium]|nr:hypothetical protein [Betaproteobacteria bacterium]